MLTEHQMEPSISIQAEGSWGSIIASRFTHKGKIWHFSDEEKRHLMLATAAFTFALGLLMAGGIFELALKAVIEQWLAVVYYPCLSC